MVNTPQTLTTTVATRILHEDTDDDEEADGEEPCDLEAWETLRNSFKEVQSVLDHNRRLIHWLTTITCPKTPQFGQECQFDSPRSPASPPPSRTPLGTAAPPATMSSRRCPQLGELLKDGRRGQIQVSALAIDTNHDITKAPIEKNNCRRGRRSEAEAFADKTSFGGVADVWEEIESVDG
ncbi:ELF4-like protein [Striga asiatica]|uniref:ELF4-like protein n=1 Tax=Striga asiatica TaxID=4170 RepID=A0A5A7PBE3_STRAF|nr:ELF4-like protein [Striga asiatica]